MQSANDIRKEFLEYFHRHDHEIVDSSPLVPRNDPTLMFTNAGMVQFKNVFTGAEKRDYQRAVTAQKCVRAGGKHNDLENVGRTARHHTFFEMLGNFSFGDYFKERAIELAWNLMTKEYGLAADQLLVTVYGEDDEAFNFWKKIAGLPESRIIRISTSDNFWAMGDTGPCGPCSEIFYDHGPDIPGGPPGSPDEDGDRFIEIWNLVFMQYEQVTKDKRIDLPKPSVDTGMGLERIAAVMQGKHDNYDIDLMRALIEASAEATGTDPDGPGKISHRVIADHLRASAFLIADGVTPSNEGRGYVLRRIMRRAMRHVEMLGGGDPVMWRLVPALVAQMGGHFTELQRAEPLIAETMKLEESNFKKTLSRGLRILETETARLGEGEPLPGEIAFRLYDTYGFPLDLTQDALTAARDARWIPRALTPLWPSSASRRVLPGRAPARRRPTTSGSTCAISSAPVNFWATLPKPAEGVVLAITAVDRPDTPYINEIGPGAIRSPSSSTRLPSTANRAARWAMPGDDLRRWRAGRNYRYPEEARRPACPYRYRGGGYPEAWRYSGAAGRPRPSHALARQPFGYPSSA